MGSFRDRVVQGWWIQELVNGERAAQGDATALRDSDRTVDTIAELLQTAGLREGAADPSLLIIPAGGKPERFRE